MGSKGKVCAKVPVEVRWAGRPPSFDTYAKKDVEVAEVLSMIRWTPRSADVSRLLGLDSSTAYDRVQRLFERRKARIVVHLDGEDPYARIAELEAKMARMVNVECDCGATLYSISSRKIGFCAKCSRKRSKTARK